jgi:hypothetical protein
MEAFVKGVLQKTIEILARVGLFLQKGGMWSAPLLGSIILGDFLKIMKSLLNQQKTSL